MSSPETVLATCEYKQAPPAPRLSSAIFHLMQPSTQKFYDQFLDISTSQYGKQNINMNMDEYEMDISVSQHQSGFIVFILSWVTAVNGDTQRVSLKVPKCKNGYI